MFLLFIQIPSIFDEYTKYYLGYPTAEDTYLSAVPFEILLVAYCGKAARMENRPLCLGWNLVLLLWMEKQKVLFLSNLLPLITARKILACPFETASTTSSSICHAVQGIMLDCVANVYWEALLGQIGQTTPDYQPIAQVVEMFNFLPDLDAQYEKARKNLRKVIHNQFCCPCSIVKNAEFTCEITRAMEFNPKYGRMEMVILYFPFLLHCLSLFSLISQGSHCVVSKSKKEFLKASFVTYPDFQRLYASVRSSSALCYQLITSWKQIWERTNYHTSLKALDKSNLVRNWHINWSTLSVIY